MVERDRPSQEWLGYFHAAPTGRLAPPQVPAWVAGEARTGAQVCSLCLSCIAGVQRV